MLSSQLLTLYYIKPDNLELINPNPSTLWLPKSDVPAILWSQEFSITKTNYCTLLRDSIYFMTAKIECPNNIVVTRICNHKNRLLNTSERFSSMSLTSLSNCLAGQSRKLPSNRCNLTTWLILIKFFMLDRLNRHVKWLGIYLQ